MPLYRDKASGIYYVDLYAGPPGRRRRVRRSARTSDRKVAQDYHDRLQAELYRQHQLGERPRRTWQEAVVSYMAGRESRASYEQDVQRLKWLHGHLGDLALDEVTADVLEQLKQARLEEAAPSTVNRLLTLVRAVLNHAHDREWINRVPKVKPAKEPPRRVQWLTVEEADRLLVHLPPHLQDFVQMALCTGLRMRNITHLEWNQVDLARRTAWIHPDQAKAGRAITIPLKGRAVEILEAQQGRHPLRVFTFRGRPYDRVNQRTLQKAAKAAKIEKHVHPHLFRHTWASWLLTSGVSLAELQALGGWSKIESVQIYAHLSAEHLRHAVDRTEIGQSWMETKTASTGEAV